MLKISKDLFDLLYPVGTYYETSNSNWTPSSAGWYGTWQEDTGGKTTVAKDSGTFNTLGASVGSESKTTGNHTITVDEMPSHTHSQNQHSHAGLSYGNPDGGGNTIVVSTNYNSTGCIELSWKRSSHGAPYNNVYTKYATATNNNTGGGTAHNHGYINVIQPSVVVRRWHRTA